MAPATPAGEPLDRELLRRSAAGDEGSFARLVARHRTPILRFLHRLTGDRTLAEDLGQETFLRVHRRAHQFQGPAAGGGPVRAWIFAIARNLALDHGRLRFRLLGRRGLARSLESAPEPEEGSRPDREAQREEVRRRVAEEVTGMPEPFRSALLLVDLSLLSYEEAALALGCNTKTLSSRLSRARHMLRDRLDVELLESLE